MGGLTSAVGEIGTAYSSLYKENVANQNAQLSDQAARDAVARGSQAVAREQIKGATTEGKQAAAYGASGVTLAGSPTDVMTDTRYFTDINVQREMNNAAREAYGYAVKAGQFRMQAQQAGAEGSISIASQAIGGGFSGGSYLGGGSGGGGE